MVGLEPATTGRTAWDPATSHPITNSVVKKGERPVVQYAVDQHQALRRVADASSRAIPAPPNAKAAPSRFGIPRTVNGGSRYLFCGQVQPHMVALASNSPSPCARVPMRRGHRASSADVDTNLAGPDGRISTQAQVKM